MFLFLSAKVKQFVRSFILASVTAIFLVVIPGLSQTVQITPNNPQLGDTLSVVIEQPDRKLSTPTVNMNGKTYPSFSIGQNRFRALLPTTPLDKSGQRLLQVTTDTGLQLSLIHI